MRNSHLRLVLGLAAVCGLTAFWVIPSYGQMPGTLQRPGMTEARVWINNRTREEAIPVTWAGGDFKAPVPVTLQGPTTVSISGIVEAKTSAARQLWEYRESPSTIATLNALGNDGWEVVGVVQSGANPTVLLKRPR